MRCFQVIFQPLAWKKGSWATKIEKAKSNEVYHVLCTIWHRSFSNQDCLEIHSHEECQFVTRWVVLFFPPMIITESITRQKEVERRMNAEECKVYISHQNTSIDLQKKTKSPEDLSLCKRHRTLNMFWIEYLRVLTNSTSRVYLCASDTALCAPVWPPVSKSLSVFLPSLSLQVIDCWLIVFAGLADQKLGLSRRAL